MDRVSILPGVMRSAACVAGAVDDGVCPRRRRSSACVAEEDDEGRQVRAEAMHVLRRVERGGRGGGRGDGDNGSSNISSGDDKRVAFARSWGMQRWPRRIVRP